MHLLSEWKIKKSNAKLSCAWRRPTGAVAKEGSSQASAWAFGYTFSWHWLANNCFPFVWCCSPKITQINFMMLACFLTPILFNERMYFFYRWSFFWKWANMHYLRDLSFFKGLEPYYRGVAIFAKACFGHPSPSKRQKLNATTNAFGAPDVLRTCHFATPS